MAKPPKETKGAGRPSDYKPEFTDEVRKFLLLNKSATDDQIAEYFGKSRSTISKWKVDYPAFSDAIRAGKEGADVLVANALHQRATGAKWTEEVAFKCKETHYGPDGKKLSEIEVIKTMKLEKQAPPDTPAIALWLRNRKPDEWAAKPSMGGGGDDVPESEYTLKPDEPVPNAPHL